jgi:hypothetical protein
MPKPFWPHLSVFGLVLALAQPGYAQAPQKEIRDSAIAAIRKSGGRVVQDTDDPKKAWVEVELSGNPNRITDETIQKIRDHLRNLGTINKLDLGYAKITDDGLKHLEDMDGIRGLSLAFCPIGDAALSHLRRLPKLGALWLTGTRIGDNGSKDLGSLTRLHVLYLGGTRITDKGLIDLKKLTELRLLWLHSLQITDNGILNIK